MKSKFRYSLENFRGVAIIFVMLSHIMSIQNMGKVGDVFYYLVGDATAWFIFISGYLFYYLEINKFNYFDYLKKKVKFVVLPYLILSFPAILFWIYSSQHVIYGLTAIKYFFWSLIAGGIAVGPMWFIPMIVIFFLLTPVFNILSKTKFIYIFVAVSLGFSLFSSRSIYNANALLSFMHFLGFYLLGMVAAKDAAALEALKTSTKVTLIFIAIFVFIIFGLLFPGIDNIPSSFFSGLGFLNYILVGKLALLVAIFLIFERFFERQNKVLGYFAKISFGLFFIHGFMGAVFQRVSRDIHYASPMLKLLCEVGVIVFVSVAVVYVLKKFLGKWSRYVIGC